MVRHSVVAIRVERLAVALLATVLLAGLAPSAAFGEPLLGGASCTGATNLGPEQLTLCVSVAAPGTCDPATEVLFNGHCFYLDGSGGVCDSGYVLASQSVLFTIARGFAGKTYKHQVSGNCCIFNSDPVENWGMDTGVNGHCNRAGLFSSSQGAPVPALSERSTLILLALLTSTGFWSLRRSRLRG